MKSENPTVSLSTYLVQVRQHWKSMMVFSLIGGICFYAYSYLAPTLYMSSAIVTPSDAITQDLSSQMDVTGSSVTSALRSSLLGGGGGDRSTEYKTVLNSEAFARRVMLENNWIPKLFPVGWNAQQGRWNPTGDIDLNPLRLLSGLLPSPPAVPASGEGIDQDDLVAKVMAIQLAGGPTMYDAVKKFQAVVSTDLDERSGYISISATTLSPSDARMFVQGMIDALNRTERERALRDAQAEVTYLKGQISNEQNETIRAAYLGVLQRQLKIQMLTSVVKDYAVREIVPPIVPEIKSSPIRRLYLLFGIIVGLISFALYELWLVAFGLRAIRLRWSVRRPRRLVLEKIYNET